MFFKRGKKKQDTVQELKPVYKLSGQNNKIFIIENGTEREITYSEKVAGIEIKIQGNPLLISIIAYNSNIIQ